MSVIKIEPIRPHGNTVWCVTAVAIMLMVTGCANNFGQFVRSAEVTAAFRNGDAQPDYQYFYSGRETMPYAIIGIDRSFTVPSRFWIPFDAESETLSRMSGNIYGATNYYPSGFQIIDTDGTVVGVWFSSIDFRSVRVDREKRTVEILFTNPESRRRF